MLTKSFLTVAFALLNFVALAQFGPGGVGNSSNNGIWLRADALSLANGASVTSWTDRSGNANNADNGVVAEQPVFSIPGAINNRPTIYFDGSDQLIVPDADILDNSAGITFYTVLRPTGLNGAARGIVGKRITFTVAVEYAYTFFFWASNYLNLDVHTNNDRFSTTPTAYANNINYMPGFIFDGALPAAERSKIYNAGTLVKQATETSTALPNSNQDLCIGAILS